MRLRVLDVFVVYSSLSVIFVFFLCSILVVFCALLSCFVGLCGCPFVFPRSSAQDERPAETVGMYVFVSVWCRRENADGS